MTPILAYLLLLDMLKPVIVNIAGTKKYCKVYSKVINVEAKSFFSELYQGYD